jgi:RNase P subunit RPR2
MIQNTRDVPNIRTISAPEVVRGVLDYTDRNKNLFIFILRDIRFMRRIINHLNHLNHLNYISLISTKNRDFSASMKTRLIRRTKRTMCIICHEIYPQYEFHIGYNNHTIICQYCFNTGKEPKHH